MKFIRLLSILLGLVLVALSAGGSGTAAEKSFPQKPITIIVPRAPGGVVDVTARLIQAPLSKALGTNVVVRNVSSGSGNVGQQEVFKADPDGYKLLASIYPAAAINEIMGKGEYKTKEYTYLYNFASTEGMTLFVADNSPFKTFADFLAAAKKGEVSVSGTGFRSNSFMLYILINQAFPDLKIKYVSYDGGGPAAVAVAGGHVNGGLSGLSSTVSLAKAKKVRLLTLFSEIRSPIFPDVPTIAQDTGKKIEVPGPIGVFGPPNMPQDVTNILVKAMAEVAKDPELIKQFTSQGLESTPLGPDEFKAAIFKQWDLVNSMKDKFR